MLDERSDVTQPQLTAVFMATLKAHKRKLAVLTDFSRNDPTFDIEQETREETAMGIFYYLLSRYAAGFIRRSISPARFNSTGKRPKIKNSLQFPEASPRETIAFSCRALTPSGLVSDSRITM